ncbi:MAG: hypothetical protein ACRCV3_05260 [Desulfovibrionaceae bacterium]
MSKTERPRIEGNFHRISSVTLGTAGTLRKTFQKTYWYVEEDEYGFLYAQILTSTNKRIGKIEKMTLEEFLKRFIPDISYPTPIEQIDEKTLIFLTMIMELYFEHNLQDNALSLLRSILDSKYPFASEIKNACNTMVVLLRKYHYFDEIAELYTKALLAIPKSSLLYFNLARLYFDIKQYDKCTENLLHAFDVAKEKKQIILFLFHLHNKQYIPEQYAERVKNIIRVVNA